MPSQLSGPGRAGTQPSRCPRYAQGPAYRFPSPPPGWPVNLQGRYGRRLGRIRPSWARRSESSPFIGRCGGPRVALARGCHPLRGGYASYNCQGLTRGDTYGEETAVSWMRLSWGACDCARDLSRRYRQCLLWTEQTREPFAANRSCRGDADLVGRHRPGRGTVHHPYPPPSSSAPPPAPSRALPNDRSPRSSWLPPPF